MYFSLQNPSIPKINSWATPAMECCNHLARPPSPLCNTVIRRRDPPPYPRSHNSCMTPDHYDSVETWGGTHLDRAPFQYQNDYFDLLFWYSLLMMSISPVSTAIFPKSETAMLSRLTRWQGWSSLQRRAGRPGRCVRREGGTTWWQYQSDFKVGKCHQCQSMSLRL